MAESVAKLLECPICLQLFNGRDKLPKLLPCQHTYCIQCLRKLARNVLECPECRVRHKMTSAGVTSFPHNITIMRLLDAHKTDSKTSELRNSLTKNMHFLRDKLSRVKDNAYYREQLRQKSVDIKRDIDRSFDAMIDEVRQRKGRVLKELKAIKKKKLAEFDQERSQHQEEINDLSEQIAAMETALISTNIGGESMFREQLKKSENLLKRLRELEPRSVSYLAFKDDNKDVVLESLFDFGCIEDDGVSQATFSFVVENVSKLKETALSLPTIVRNLPWRVMAMPRSSKHERQTKCLGFFLQCNGDCDSPHWSCHATADLILKNHKKDKEDHVKRISHVFYNKENDWGFGHFISWTDLLDPERGFVVDDSIHLEVNLFADAPHGVRKLEKQQRKDKSEAHLYMMLQVYTEDQFYGHQGNDLFDSDKIKSRDFRILKSLNLPGVMELLSESYGFTINNMRIWPISLRTNQTYRPTTLEVEDAEKTVHDIAENDPNWIVFLETADLEIQAALPAFDKDSDVLLFLKKYDPKTKTISYCGHITVSIAKKIYDLIPTLCERGRFPEETPLLIYKCYGYFHLYVLYVLLI